MSFKSHVTLANSKIRIFDKWSSSLSTCMQVLLPKRCQFRAKKNPKTSWQLSYLSGHIATFLQPKKANSWNMPKLWKLGAFASKHGVPKPSKAIWTCLTFSRKKMGSCGSTTYCFFNLGEILNPKKRFPRCASNADTRCKKCPKLLHIESQLLTLATTIRTKKNIDMKEWKAQMEQTGLVLVSKLKL